MSPTTLERFLQITEEHSRTNDGPIAVLIVVCILFCFIWSVSFLFCVGGDGGDGGAPCCIVVYVLTKISSSFHFRTPMLCQRRCRVRRRQRTEQQAAEIIRVSLANWNMLGLEDSMGNTNSNGGHGIFPTSISNPHNTNNGASRGMSLEDRREFIKNILVSRVSGYIHR
jgi:hypothetical protein